MSPPVRLLNSELMERNPPLRAFSDFIQKKSGKTPSPDRIQVLNPQPQDGYLDLQYAADRQIFLARINAHKKIIQLHHGKFLPKSLWPDWGAGPVEVKVTGTCRALHSLGGADESRVLCNDSIPADRNLEKALWWGGTAGVTVGLLEAAWRFRGRGSLVWNLGSSVLRGARLGSGPRPGLWQWTREATSLGIGLGAMVLARPLADALGLHPRDERHERRALAIGLGYGSYRMSRVFASRFGKGLPPSPMGLGAGLLASALLEGSLGRLWEEGSGSRLWVRDLGFFLPALSRSFQGGRSWALLEQPGWKGFAKWTGRVMTAGFLADLGYLVYNHGTLGPSGAVINNRLYARANQLHDEQAHPLTLLVKGACSLVAPALTEHAFVPSRYVDQAREEMRYQDLKYVASLEVELREQVALRLAQGGDPAAWEKDGFWQWLREEVELKDLVVPGGKSLPVRAVAEQLADPKVQKGLAGKTEAEVVGYLRRQFRGWDLNSQEVRTILDQIRAHFLRQRLASLPLSMEPRAQSLRALLDEQGRLLPGAGVALIRHLFPRVLG